MPISIIDNFDVNAPKNIDGRLGPYDTTASAKAAIDETTQRYLGLTIVVTGSGNLEEYWFQDGVTDSDLVLKPSSAGEGGIFKQTGSYYATTNNLQVTGSFSVGANEVNGRILSVSSSVALFAIQAGNYVFHIAHDYLPQIGLGYSGWDLNIYSPITASSDISASGNLFASASDGAGINHVALYNTSSGQFFYTASNAIGGSGGGTDPKYLVYETGSGTDSIKPAHGNGNVASGTRSTVAGGKDNEAKQNNAFVGGGEENCALQNKTAVLGGEKNRVCQQYSVGGGGFGNTINSEFSGIWSGCNNITTGNSSAILGGRNNEVTGDCSIIVGGKYNCVQNAHGGILGGQSNNLQHDNSFILGSNLTSSQADTTYTQNIIASGSIIATGSLFVEGQDSLLYVDGDDDITISSIHDVVVSSTNFVVTGSNGATFSTPNGFQVIDAQVISLGTSGLTTVLDLKSDDIQFDFFGSPSPSAGDVVVAKDVNGNLKFTASSAVGADSKYLVYETGSGGNSFTSSIVPVGGINFVGQQYSVISGGSGSQSTLSQYSVIGGGANNRIDCANIYSTIGGGSENYIGEYSCNSTIGGGAKNNIKSGDLSSICNNTIAGGCNNEITLNVNNSGILGGVGNKAQHQNSFILGSNITSSQVDTTYTQNIIATGSISASNEVSADTIVVGSTISHIGDSNTKIEFQDDDINLTVAGKTAIDLTWDGTGGGDTREITFNEGQEDFDVRIEGDTDANLFFTNAGTDRVGIGTNSPGEKLTVEGNISASGFVSASGFIYSDEKLSIPLVDITSSGGDVGQIKMGPNKDQVISGYEDQINIDGDNVIRLQADNTISFVVPLITNQSNNGPSEFNFTGSIITTGSLVVTGSIGMALPSASAFKSFGVPGYYKTTISLASDAEIFRDENIRIEYNEAGTDQLEGQIYTDPSSGLVDIVYYNDADGSYSTTERNIASGEFDIDAAFTGWIKAELEIYAPNDNNYPYYHISIISRDISSNEAFAITQKFV